MVRSSISLPNQSCSLIPPQNNGTPNCALCDVQNFSIASRLTRLPGKCERSNWICSDIRTRKPSHRASLDKINSVDHILNLGNAKVFDQLVLTELKPLGIDLCERQIERPDSLVEQQSERGLEHYF